MTRISLLAGAFALALLASPSTAQVRVDPAVSGLPGAVAPANGDIVDIRQGGQRKAATVAQLQGLQDPPAGFRWDFAAHPLNVFRSPNGRYYTDLDPRSVPSIATIFSRANQSSGSTQIVYADAAAADNTGAGTSATTPKQGIRQALAVCEANTAASYCLGYVKAGDYDRTRDFNGTSGAASYITKPTALVCYGGPCIISPTQKGLSWTANGSAWQAARSATGHVLNEVANDGFGDRNDFAVQASVAAVQGCTNQDCMFTDGTTLTIKRADGAQPTDANTRVLLNSDAMNLGPNAVSFYASGFTVLGGITATLADTQALRAKDVVIQDSYFAYPSGAAKNVVAIDNLIGLVAFFRVTADKGSADAFNVHANSAATATDWLLVDSFASDLGRAGSASNNCVTGHEGGLNDVRARIIVLGGGCKASSGSSVRPIGGSQIWLAGYTIDTDLGDIQFGGNVPSSCLHANDVAAIWAQDVRCLRSLNSAIVGSTASIYVRRLDDGGGQRSGAGAVQGF